MKHHVEPEDVRPGWLCALGSGDDDEVEMLGAIYRDIARHAQAEPGKGGPKPSTLDPHRTRQMLREFVGDDHTTLPFDEAFRILAGTRSVRHLAATIGMSKDKVFRLLRGRKKPTRDEIVTVAVGLKKHPSFFREYRNNHLVEELLKHLDDLPESSIDFYRKSVNSNR